jgi:hypothetical protein
LTVAAIWCGSGEWADLAVDGYYCDAGKNAPRLASMECSRLSRPVEARDSGIRTALRAEPTEATLMNCLVWRALVAIGQLGGDLPDAPVPGFTRWLQIRPEVGYYRSWTVPAFDLGTRRNMIMCGFDTTLRF